MRNFTANFDRKLGICKYFTVNRIKGLGNVHESDAFPPLFQLLTHAFQLISIFSDVAVKFSFFNLTFGDTRGILYAGSKKNMNTITNTNISIW